MDFLARFPSGFSLFVRLPSGAFVTFASKRFTTVQQFNNSAFHQFIISSNQQFSSLVGALRCKSFCRLVSQFTFQFLIFCSLLAPSWSSAPNRSSNSMQFIKTQCNNAPRFCTRRCPWATIQQLHFIQRSSVSAFLQFKNSRPNSVPIRCQFIASFSLVTLRRGEGVPLQCLSIACSCDKSLLLCTLRNRYPSWYWMLSRVYVVCTAVQFFVCAGA